MRQLLKWARGVVYHEMANALCFMAVLPAAPSHSRAFHSCTSEAALTLLPYLEPISPSWFAGKDDMPSRLSEFHPSGCVLHTAGCTHAASRVSRVRHPEVVPRFVVLLAGCVSHLSHADQSIAGVRFLYLCMLIGSFASIGCEKVSTL